MKKAFSPVKTQDLTQKLSPPTDSDVRITFTMSTFVYVILVRRTMKLRRMHIIVACKTDVMGAKTTTLFVAGALEDVTTLSTVKSLTQPRIASVGLIIGDRKFQNFLLL